MRGKGGGAPHIVAVLGITPACAGKSAFKGMSGSGQRDHPRVCGEKEPYSVFRLSQQGSPPRMRGKGTDGAAEHGLYGITPAYAGKS